MKERATRASSFWKHPSFATGRVGISSPAPSLFGDGSRLSAWGTSSRAKQQRQSFFKAGRLNANPKGNKIVSARETSKAKHQATHLCRRGTQSRVESTTEKIPNGNCQPPTQLPRSTNSNRVHSQPPQEKKTCNSIKDITFGRKPCLIENVIQPKSQLPQSAFDSSQLFQHGPLCMVA